MNIIFGITFYILNENYFYGDALNFLNYDTLFDILDAQFIDKFNICDSSTLSKINTFFISTIYDLKYSPIFIIGSLMAYLASQTFDVWFFNYLKEKTDGKKLWLRNNLSTMTSQLIDTLIYQFTWVIATDLTFAEAFGLAVVKYIFKFIIAIVDTVFIYIVRGWNVPE